MLFVLGKASHAYAMLAFGDNESQPFTALADVLAAADAVRECPPTPATAAEMLACFSVQVGNQLIQPTLLRMVTVGPRDPRDELFDQLFHAHISPICSDFLRPA